MKCPLCNVDLTMSERQGIEIDYCPNCRGVWLDRGELDKIIERSTSPMPDKHHDNWSPGYQGHQYGHDHHGHGYHGSGHHKKKKYKSFLEELFD